MYVALKIKGGLHTGQLHPFFWCHSPTKAVIRNRNDKHVTGSHISSMQNPLTMLLNVKSWDHAYADDTAIAISPYGGIN